MRNLWYPTAVRSEKSNFNYSFYKQWGTAIECKVLSNNIMIFHNYSIKSNAFIKLTNHDNYSLLDRKYRRYCSINLSQNFH